MILVSCIIIIFMFVMSAGSRFWARLWSPGKGVTGEGLWFDLIRELEMTCEADETSVFSHQFQMNLHEFCSILVQIRRSMLGLPDARYTFQKCCCAFEALDISGSTFAKAGAEPDRVNDDSNCAALLAAAVNDSTDVGIPRKEVSQRVEPCRALVSSDQNPSQLVYVVEITQFYGVWNILMWIWIWNVRHKWRHP